MGTLELVAKMVMQIANGRPKNAHSTRRSSLATNHASNWVMAYITKSEESLRSLATTGRYGGKIQGGALVRMIDICLPSGLCCTNQVTVRVPFSADGVILWLQ